jgi:hypothetical protein
MARLAASSSSADLAAVVRSGPVLMQGDAA